MATEKPVSVLVLDAGPIIKNEPQVSTLIAKAEKLVTTPAVLSEIRDENARSRVQTTLMPFMELLQPDPAAIKFVQEFARKTGDLAVLSRQDVEILALSYQLECEKNGGDWRLRKAPGQKRTNGPNPNMASSQDKEPVETEPTGDWSRGLDAASPVETQRTPIAPWAKPPNPGGTTEPQENESSQVESPKQSLGQDPAEECRTSTQPVSVTERSSSANAPLQDLVDSSPCTEQGLPGQAEAVEDGEGSITTDSGSDSEGWITPSNVNRRLTQPSPRTKDQPEPRVMQVATLTTDFAMQNVLLQVNLNLLSPSLQRVKHLRRYILRCHACFQTTGEVDKQFCPRCGKPALMRVACTTNGNGEVKMHLKKNMQWNHRGDRYSIPKPVSGAANGRIRGGGKGGWGNELILAEDQKEYLRAVDTEKRDKKRADLLDIDYVPAMLSGSGKRDGRPGGRPKVGAGKNANSKKR